MRYLPKSFALVLCAILISVCQTSSRLGDLPSPAAATRVAERPIAGTKYATSSVAKAVLARAPLTFERNDGQFDNRTQFAARGQGYQVFLSGGDAVLWLRQSDTSTVTESVKTKSDDLPRRRQNIQDQATVFRMRLVDSTHPGRAVPEKQLTGRSNYFKGDRSAWRTEIPTYERVRYASVYPGVDLVYYGNQRQLEYDFVVAPGADPSRIGLAFDGVAVPRLGADGGLQLSLPGGDVQFRAPVAYQDVDGQRVEVASRFELRDGIATFALGSYDSSHPLVIDPVFSYAGYIGGSNVDQGNGIALDAAGNIYVTGFTASMDFPTTASWQTSSGSMDAFVTKLDPAGNVVYSSVFGGSQSDSSSAIAVDAAGAAYVTGYTQSINFPLVSALQSTHPNNYEVFVTKIGPTGATLEYSTYLGGTGFDAGYGIAVDAAGHAYVVGQAGDGTMFNATGTTPVNAFAAGGANGFICELNAAGTALAFARYLSFGSGHAVTLDGSGNAFVTGRVFATAGYNVLVARINAGEPRGQLGLFRNFGQVGTEDSGHAIAVDAAGNIYVTGSTDSTNFPTSNAIQTDQASTDAFVLKLDPTGTTLLYSTYLGGSDTDFGQGLAVDAAGNAYVAGWTASTDFLVSGPLQVNQPSDDAFLTRLDPLGALVYSTYLGGSGGDRAAAAALFQGSVYLTGSTNAGFPGFPGAGAAEAFVVQIAPFSVSSVLPNTGPAAGGTPITITGTGFPAGASVLVGGAPATSVVVVDSSTITAVTPAHGAGTVDVTVLEGEAVVTLSNAFTFVAGPQIASISPPAGPSVGGTAVTITGSQFVGGAMVSVGGALASVTSLSSGSIGIVTPPHARGAVDVTVTNPDAGTHTLPGGFTYVNSPPSVDAQLVTTAEDAPIAISLAAFDFDSDPLTYSLTSPPSHGVLAGTAPSLTYTPAANYFGGDSFTFKVNDGALDSNVAVVTVTINPINDAPVALNSVYPAVEDTPVSASFQATDVDGPSLVFSIVSNGAKGTAVLTNAATGAFTYTPNSNANGTDVVTFQAFDGSVFSDVATFTINIAAVNDSTTPQSGVVTATEGAAVSGTLQAADIDTTALTFSVATQPARGTVTITDVSTGAFTYTPNSGTTGYDPFTFAVNDGTNSATATEMVFIVANSPRWPGQTVRSSVAGDGTQGDRDSGQPVLSADGRYAAFDSSATNLVAGDSNGASDVFVHDRQTGETQRVSVASDGSEGNSFSSLPALSADGRYVAFRSDASNLVAGDTNNTLDVFVRDRQTGETRRVSVASDGAEGNGVSDRPALSADGRYVAFRSDAGNMVANDTNGTSDVFVHDRQTGQTQRLSVASDATPGNDYSYEPSLSADGRYVVFSSFASNLVAGDTNNRADVFVHDRQTGETRRVSVASAGAQSNGDSYQPSLSADGRYVAFISLASNLVAGDTNLMQDVFVHDRQTGQTWRVSVASAGTQANAESYQTSLSADGRYVAFVSVASNLVAGDTNGTRDMFVHDRQTGETRRVSVASNGTQGNNHSIDPALSADARYAAFTSYASNLVAGDTNGYVDVFVVGAAPSPGVPAATDDAITTVEDIAASGVLHATDPNGAPLTFALVSSGALGTATLIDAATGAYTYTPNPNATGTDTFTFQASNGAVTSNVATVTVTIAPINDAPLALNGQASGVEDTPLSATLQATDVDGPSLVFSIVANGAKGTAVVTNASTGTFTYTPNANANGTDVVAFQAFDGSVFSNVATFTINIAAVNDPPTPQSGVVTASEGAAVSGTLGGGDIDSTALTFSVATQPARGTVTITNASTGAFTYTPNSGTSGYDPFTFAVNDGTNSATTTQMVFVVASSPRWPGQTVRVSVASNGIQGNDGTGGGRVSADGRFIAFQSNATNLVPGDTNGTSDIFVHDRLTGQTRRVSVGSGGTQANSFSSEVAISADGRYVAFESLASNLVPGDTNNVSDIFLHDLELSTTTRVSVGAGGAQGAGASRGVALSADGRYVAFSSDAENLVTGDSNGWPDVFVYDRISGGTYRASVGSDGTQANGFGGIPRISADGQVIVFHSNATNLVPGAFFTQVYVHDRRSGQTSLASVATSGAIGNFASVDPNLSADGRVVVYRSAATNLVASDTNGQEDIFVRDLATATTRRVSIASNGDQANNRSIGASISADGRFVAFASLASNLIAGDSNGRENVFVHDRLIGRTYGISVSSDGQQASADSSVSSISADGRFIGFASYASNLVDNDTNGALDSFVIGGVSVDPLTASVSASGGTGSLNVAFAYPGTAWSAISNAPWITITNQSSTNGNGTASYSVAPNTGAQRVGTLTVALQTITVTQSASSTPVASNGVASTNEDVSVTGTLSATDPNGDPLTFAVVTNGALGAATITNPATGAYTYTPNANANGTDTFTFVARDGVNTSNVATVTVSIAPINDAPLALNGQASGVEDTPLSASFQATDVDGPSLVFSIVANGAKGTAVLTNAATGTFTYTPNANANGTDVLTFQAFDGSVFSNTATFTINIAAANDAPASQSGVVTTSEGAAVSGTLQATDIDTTGLTFSVAMQPAQGSVTITDASTGAFTYTPNSGATGYDPFTFAVSDGTNVSTAAEMVFIVANSPRWPGQTVLASVHTNGTRGNGMSSGSTLSGDGRYLVFWSSASNLVTGDTNNVQDVFVRDRATGETRRLSVAPDGSQGNNQSINPSITPDGRYVAFISYASNLVPNDNNNQPDVFVRDLATGVTERVNVATNGAEAANGWSFYRPSISADGRYVAFESSAMNLVAGDTNGQRDVFVRDRVARVTTRVSVATGGVQALNESSSTSSPVMSADGRYVAFLSRATNLVPGDTNGTLEDVYVHDRATGQTMRVSVDADGSQMDATAGSSAPLAMSANGRFIVFEGGRNTLPVNIFVRDLVAQQTLLVSQETLLVPAPDRAFAVSPAVSADGRFVAFEVWIQDGDTFQIDSQYISMTDRVTGDTRRVDVDSAGIGGDNLSVEVTVSADGRFVSGRTRATNLEPPATDADQIFVVGGVTVSPRFETVDAAGASGTVAVGFVYPGTPWSAISAVPWITISNQSSTNGNGTVSYSVAPNTGAGRVGTLTVAAQTITITQSGRTIPVAADSLVTTNEDVAVSGTLSATDPSGAPLTFAIVSNGAVGTAIITNASTGAYTYTPNANANGTDTFTFKVNNGTSDSNVATVTVTVNPVDDAPVASNGSLPVNQDAAANGTFVATDIDGPALSYRLVTNGTLGTAVVTNAATGAFTYTPNAGATGSDSIQFRANDGTLDSNVGTVSITIAATAPLTVTVDVPNGGERVFIGAASTIRWSATGATSFDVELSRNNGGLFGPIPGCTGLPGTARSCVWTPTSPTSGAALIRVTARNAAGATANDRSNAVFAIVSGTPTITVSAPNTAVTWAIGMQRAITWTHNLGAVSFMRVELSRNGGTAWETLAASVQNTTASAGTFNWTVTGPPTSTALIRVTWLDGPATDVSNTVFAIQSPAVTVTTPNTAVSWRSGETRAITFSHNLGAGQVVNLDLSRDGGSTWTPLAPVTTTTSATASYSWLVTIPATARARVRATWTSNAAVTDTSDTDFTITPRVRVMSPNTATTWGAGTTRTITWNHNLPAGETVDIAFSPDNGATWVPVASGVANATTTTGSYTGRLPTTPTTQGLIKVSWSRDPMDGDVNDVPLVIQPASVTVTSPAANQVWTVGSTRNILWGHNLGAAETVSIDVSRDGGATWTNITPAAPNTATGGTFAWVVTGPATTTARVRVSWTVNGMVQSVSGNFRIQ